MRKIYVIGNDTDYANWMQGEICNTLEEADLIVFTGGEDVNPFMYGETSHETTYYNKYRDELELEYFNKALYLNKPMIGICRGSQFLCVVAGGKLVQHQSHPHFHDIEMFDGNVFKVTSSHHQAQFPFNLSNDKYKVLGWANDLSKFHLDGNGKELSPEKECEVVYYPKINALGIQSHPEWMSLDSEAVIYFQKLLNNFLDGKL